MPDGDDDLIEIGRIGPPRGVRGDVFVQPFTDVPEERFAVGSVVRTEPTAFGPLTVDTLNLSGAKMVLRFVGVDTREAAETMRGVKLVVASAERPNIEDPDEFYASDLVGLTVRTVDGTELGHVEDVIDIAGVDYLVVQVSGVERLVPFARAIVPTVDIANHQVLIDPPDGLFDL